MIGPIAGERWRAVRLVLWVVGMALVILLAQSIVSDHLVRTHLDVSQRYPPPVPGADVPLMGVNVALGQYDDPGLETALTRIEELGAVWVRQTFDWRQIEPQSGAFDWVATDRLLAALARHPDLRLVAVLQDEPPTPPIDPERFAAFAGAFAERYAEQVDHYQIWDEPNLAANWGGGPVSPPAYADLLARSTEAIRRADPGARILLAGLAPTTETGPQNLSDLRYLARLYENGAARHFDIAAAKPYGFDTGPADRRVDPAVMNVSRLILLRRVMVEHGDGETPLWASHWGWNALPADWTGGRSLWGQTDPATQATRSVDTLERARAEWPWMGVMMLEHFQPDAPPDDPRWGFALIGPDGSPRPIYHALHRWATALPDAAPSGGYPAHNRWTTYEGAWQLGPLGADAGRGGNRATFRFEGSAVALTVRRGPYRAFLYVTVDGAPANALPQDKTGRTYVVLYDVAPDVVTVPLAEHLSPGVHTVELEAAGGQGQWTVVDWRVGVAPGEPESGLVWKVAALAGAALLMAALLWRELGSIDWRAWVRCVRAWPQWRAVALALILAGALWWVAGQSWGRDWASPWLPVSLLLCGGLVALFAARLDLGLALVALVAPFYLHPGHMVYRALSLPEALILLTALAALLRGRFAGLARRSVRGLDLAGVLMLAAAGFSALSADDPTAALFELRSVFLLPALYYVLLRRARLDRAARYRLVDAWMVGALGVALVGLVQVALGRNLVYAEGGLPRLQSVYFSPNNVGLYLGRAWPMLVAVAVGGASRQRRLAYGLMSLPITLALVLSFSRGALLLGVPAAVAVMSWWAGRRWRWAVVALAVLAALLAVPLMRVPRFGSLLDLHQGSTFFRLELWRSSLRMIADHPWLGLGPGNFQSAYRTRYVLPSAWQEFDLEHAHNIYLDHWTRLGVLGLVALVVGQVAFWRVLRRWPAGRALTIGLAGAMVAFLAHGLVDNVLFFPDLALTFVLMWGLASDPAV